MGAIASDLGPRRLRDQSVHDPHEFDPNAPGGPRIDKGLEELAAERGSQVLEDPFGADFESERRGS